MVCFICLSRECHVYIYKVNLSRRRKGTRQNGGTETSTIKGKDFTCKTRRGLSLYKELKIPSIMEGLEKSMKSKVTRRRD